MKEEDNMKKIIVICIFLLTLSIASCTNKQENKDNKSAQESSKQIETSSINNKKTIEKYAGLIGLTKEELIKAMGEEPNAVDEGGLEFPKDGIRIWFGDDGKTVNQVWMSSIDIDFNGAKIGETIEDFKNIFGKAIQEDTSSAYSNFNYKNLILNVNYDPNTKKVFAVYLVKEWK